MKYIELKVVPYTHLPIKPPNIDEAEWVKAWTVDYQKTIETGLRQRPVATYDEIKKTGRILHQLEKLTSGEDLVLDDADFDYMVTAVNQVQFSLYDEAVEALLEVLRNPGIGLPSVTDDAVQPAAGEENG